MVRLTLLALLPLTVYATNIDNSIMNQKRQGVNLSTGPSSSDSTSTSSNEPSVSSSSTSSVEPSSTSTVPPQDTSSVTTTSTTATITSSNSRSSSSTTSSSSEEFTQIITSSPSPVVRVTTYTDAGTTRIATETTSTDVAVTSRVRATGTVNSTNGSGDSGLSDSSKKIIGGVVGGIGGALLLGALAFTAWRIWGKKKNLHDDDLYDPNQQEKLSTSTETQPFRSTLDQYHQPGPVNTAANF